MLSRFARLPEASSASIRCISINSGRNSVNRGISSNKLATVASSSTSNNTKRDFHSLRATEVSFPRHKFNHRLSGSLRTMSDKAEPETVQAEVVDEESNVNAKEDYKPASSGNEVNK